MKKWRDETTRRNRKRTSRDEHCSSAQKRSEPPAAPYGGAGIFCMDDKYGYLSRSAMRSSPVTVNPNSVDVDLAQTLTGEGSRRVKEPLSPLAPSIHCQSIHPSIPSVSPPLSTERGMCCQHTLFEYLLGIYFFSSPCGVPGPAVHDSPGHVRNREGVCQQ